MAQLAEELTHSQREAAQLDLLRFTALNALSFEVLAGQILILFARQVGASPSDIGLLSALLPFAAVIQLGIAPLVAKFGPRALMLVGWSARTVVSAALFLVPVAVAAGGPSAGTTTLMVVMTGFYLCRALGMSSWLPLIQELVPERDRGMYLSRQEWLRQVSIVGVAVLTALYLLGVTGLERFLHVLAIGVLAAAGSLYFLWKVPDVGAMAEPLDRDYLSRATAPLRDALFVRYLWFSVTLRAVLSAFTPFLVVYLRDGLGLSPSGVIVVNTIGSVGAIATLALWGRATDKHGARPILGLSIGAMAVCLLLWMAARNTPAWHWVGAPMISLTLGIVMGGLNISMSKFELGFIPIQGRAHYVAMNVTLVGLGSAVAAMGAGQMLQALSDHDLVLGPVSLDRYRVFFLSLALLLVVPLLFRRSLPEERARSLATLFRRQLAKRSRPIRKLLSRPRTDVA